MTPHESRHPPTLTNIISLVIVLFFNSFVIFLLPLLLFPCIHEKVCNKLVVGRNIKNVHTCYKFFFIYFGEVQFNEV